MSRGGLLVRARMWLWRSADRRGCAIFCLVRVEFRVGRARSLSRSRPRPVSDARQEARQQGEDLSSRSCHEMGLERHAQRVQQTLPSLTSPVNPALVRRRSAQGTRVSSSTLRVPAVSAYELTKVTLSNPSLILAVRPRRPRTNTRCSVVLSGGGATERRRETPTSPTSHSTLELLSFPDWSELSATQDRPGRSQYSSRPRPLRPRHPPRHHLHTTCAALSADYHRPTIITTTACPRQPRPSTSDNIQRQRAALHHISDSTAHHLKAPSAVARAPDNHQLAASSLLALNRSAVFDRDPRRSTTRKQLALAIGF